MMKKKVISNQECGPVGGVEEKVTAGGSCCSVEVEEKVSTGKDKP